MQQLREAWFEFAGIRSTAMGIQLVAMPSRGMPVARGEFQTVPGRSGAIWQDDGAHDTIEIRMECHLPEGYNEDVAQWLMGAGKLRFSDEPNRVYDARIARSFQRSSPIPRFTAQKFTVAFTCQPYRYQYPAPADIVLAPASGSVVNPGTAASRPRIRIEGSGDCTVDIGGTLMAFEGLSDGVVVDSEAMECFDLTETQLLNSKAELDAFPVLLPGENTVLGTGSITRITITPRWRYL